MCDCVEDLFSISLSSPEGTIEVVRKFNDDGNEHITWTSLLEVFKGMLISKGFKWDEEKEKKWYSLIND